MILISIHKLQSSSIFKLIDLPWLTSVLKKSTA